jgi:hypothetical protein
MLLTMLFGSGCSGNPDQKQTGTEASGTPATDANSAEATATLAYICPMECEGSASNEPGKCPVCSMDLVKNPNYKAPAPDSAAADVVH